MSTSKLPSSTDGSPKSSPWRWLWITLGLTGVAAAAATAGALLAVAIAGTPLLRNPLTASDANIFGTGEPISTGMNLQLPTLTRPVNVLILGIKVLSTDLNDPPQPTKDLGYQAVVNSLEGLSDTMLLVRFNPENQQMVVLSIPRDTRTFVAGAGVTKINEANVDGGPALAARATSELLGGVGIDRYVRINVQGVEKLVDALGGVTVYVPKDMHYQDDSQHLYINLKQGKQHLNGAQALQLLRFRYDAYGDIGRIQRQQMVMKALMEQALKPSTVTRLPQILTTIQSNLDTNLSVEELVALVGFVHQSGRKNTQMLTIPGDFSSPEEFEASYWLPNQNKIDELVAQYFDVKTTNYSEEYRAATNPSDLRVAIQDSTGQTKATQTWLKTLQKKGYSSAFADGDWGESLDVTQIIAQQGDMATAEVIRQSLGFGQIEVDSTGNLDSDITIRLGKDALQAATKAAVSSSPTHPARPNSLPQTKPSQPSVSSDLP